MQTNEHTPTALPADVTRRIAAVDRAVMLTAANESLVVQADELLALRLECLGVSPCSRGARSTGASPAQDMATRYEHLRGRAAALLGEHALTPEALAALVDAASEDQRASDWWHVYRFAVYCVFLMIERYGQELGWPRGEASRSLVIGRDEHGPVDLRTHLDAAFAGKSPHTLSSFVFLGTPRLTVDVGAESIAYDHRGRRVDRPHNPFAVTGDGDTPRGPTAHDVTPFTELLVHGELLGYEINSRLLSAMERLASSAAHDSLAVAIEAELRPIPALLERALRGYRTFNLGSFSPADFAYVLRQFTVDPSEPPSKRWETLRGERLLPEAATSLDHFTFCLNRPRLDPRLLRSFAWELQRMLASVDDPSLRSAARRVIALLHADRPDPLRLGEAFVVLVARDAGLALGEGEAAALARQIVASDHEYVPSGSTSMVYAVLDVFFGIERLVPGYMSHLLARREHMPDRDQQALDVLCRLRDALPPGTRCWAHHVRMRYRHHDELLSLVDAIARAHAAVACAHAGVLARFVHRPGERFPEQVGRGSRLISTLDAGTTGMRFGAGGLLKKLADARRGLLHGAVPGEDAIATLAFGR